ncbi:MAG: hypothetical protein KF774_06515 [Planctomyces sp.]|nr:hypothetical protein [Planctomyces sp.]
MSELFTFDALVASRREWIDSVLIPWCRRASRADLRRAEQDWADIAGRVAPERSLWLWAWSRFPCLYVEGLGGLEESFPVRVTLASGETLEGYPENRGSERGELSLLRLDGAPARLSIDDLVSVERMPPD